MPTLQDHTIRLQQLLCCLGEKGKVLAKHMQIGKDCCKEIKTLALLHAYWQILECYDPTLVVGDQCLTQEKVDKMLNWMGTECCVCFFPYGTNYTALAARQGLLLQQSGFRILQENNSLINI